MTINNTIENPDMTSPTTQHDDINTSTNAGFVLPLYLGLLLYNQIFWKNFRRKGVLSIPAENRRILFVLYFAEHAVTYSEMQKFCSYDYKQKFEKVLKDCIEGDFIYAPLKGRYFLSWKGILWCRQVLKYLEDINTAAKKGQNFASIINEIRQKK